jgi:sec-independent protein translocase protein TatA
MGLDNPLHILILLVVVLLVFGAKRLPEIGRNLGSGMRGFKETIQGDSHLGSLDNPSATQTAPAPAPAVYDAASTPTDRPLS